MRIITISQIKPVSTTKAPRHRRRVVCRPHSPPRLRTVVRAKYPDEASVLLLNSSRVEATKSIPISQGIIQAFSLSGQFIIHTRSSLKFFSKFYNPNNNIPTYGDKCVCEFLHVILVNVSF